MANSLNPLNSVKFETTIIGNGTYKNQSPDQISLLNENICKLIKINLKQTEAILELNQNFHEINENISNLIRKIDQTYQNTRRIPPPPPPPPSFTFKKVTSNLEEASTLTKKSESKPEKVQDTLQSALKQVLCNCSGPASILESIREKNKENSSLGRRKSIHFGTKSIHFKTESIQTHPSLEQKSPEAATSTTIISQTTERSFSKIEDNIEDDKKIEEGRKKQFAAAREMFQTPH